MNNAIEIRCPKCGKMHRYRDGIFVSTFAAITPISTMLLALVQMAFQKWRYKGGPDQFTRLFTCPIKHEDFQVIFVKDSASGNFRPLSAEDNNSSEE